MVLLSSTRLTYKRIYLGVWDGYNETFTHVAQISTIRILLAVAAVRHWPLCKIDLMNAFLHGSLTVDVYMQPPPGLTIPSGHVCHLHHAIYGLKHTPELGFSVSDRPLHRLIFSIAQ